MKFILVSESDEVPSKTCSCTDKFRLLDVDDMSEDTSTSCMNVYVDMKKFKCAIWRWKSYSFLEISVGQLSCRAWISNIFWHYSILSTFSERESWNPLQTNVTSPSPSAVNRITMESVAVPKITKRKSVVSHYFHWLSVVTCPVYSDEDIRIRMISIPSFFYNSNARDKNRLWLSNI